MTTYTVNVANTWEFKTVYVSGGLITAGTWNWANGLGLFAMFTLAAGSNYQTTANAWQTGNFRATAAQVNCLDTIGNIFAITGVQLEPGVIATPFEHRSYPGELVLASRFFQPDILAMCGGKATAVGDSFYSCTNFPVPFRTTPVMTLIATIGSALMTLPGGWNNISASRAWYGVASSAAGGCFVTAQYSGSARL